MTLERKKFPAEVEERHLNLAQRYVPHISPENIEKCDALAQEIANAETQAVYRERERIMDQFGYVGEELYQNAKGLSKFPGQAFESRARAHAGMLVSSIAQILFTEIRHDDFMNRTDEILNDMKAAIGEERFEQIMQEAKEAIPDDPPEEEEGEPEKGVAKGTPKSVIDWECSVCGHRWSEDYGRVSDLTAYEPSDGEELASCPVCDAELTVEFTVE